MIKNFYYTLKSISYEISELLEVQKFSFWKKWDYPQLTDKEWLLSLSFLADCHSNINDLNIELQGKNRDL